MLSELGPHKMQFSFVFNFPGNAYTGTNEILIKCGKIALVKQREFLKRARVVSRKMVANACGVLTCGPAKLLNFEIMFQS